MSSSRGYRGLAVSLSSLALCACGPAEATQPNDDQPQPLPGKVTTALGTERQGFDGDGHAPLASWLSQPTEVGFDDSGRLYVVDWNNHRLRRVARGRVETAIGSQLPGDWPPELAADAVLAGTELNLNHPMDIAFASDGRAYLAAWHNHKILEYDAESGQVQLVAGGARPGYAGDGGAGQAALLNFPESLVIDADGCVLFADQRNNVIRRILPDGERSLSTVAGVKGPSSYAGDSGPANLAGLGLSPYNEAGGADNPPPGGGLSLDELGNLYVADTYNHCVRRILAGSDGLVGSGDPAEEVIETVAGRCGEPGFAPELEPETLLLRLPRDLELHGGALFVADSGNHVVWQVDLESGRATRVVGTGEPGSTPDGSEPLETLLNQPYGIAFDAESNLFIADTLNNRIRVLWK